MTAGLLAGVVARPAAHAATGWQTVDPVAAGFAPGLDAQFAALQKSGSLPNLHGIVALRDGRILFERYMSGADEAWGEPLGTVAFGPDTLHDMRSVSKSIVGLLYGIALGRGLVPAPDQPLLAQFPEYPDLAADPELARLAIRHALTMTLGLEWNEALPYTDPANSEIAMENAADRYRFILSRKVLGAPGTRWNYNGGATALLGRLLEKGTGVSLAAFARSALFDPLGIGPTGWAKGRDGEESAASGLRLTTRDLARIGQLILAGGRWDGRPVVPADWLTSSFQVAAIVDDNRHYGYQWYLGEFALRGRAGAYGERWIGAFGNGGQRLFVFPGLKFVLAVTAGNYNMRDQWRPPIVLLRKLFLANIVG